MIQISIKSKLNQTAYPLADPTKYLVGSWWKEVDPVLAGRLAYAAMDTGCKLTSNRAYATSEEQQKLYDQYLEYKQTGKGSIKLAAKPGTSKHEFRLAVDTSTQPIRKMTSVQLKKYGLCKPISSEGWHIEVIETASSNWKQFIPENIEEGDMDEKAVKEIINETLEGSRNEPSSWAKESVTWAVKSGFISDSKKLDGVITKEELVTILNRALGRK